VPTPGIVEKNIKAVQKYQTVTLNVTEDNSLLSEANHL
jgi:hypothetical protein